MKTSEIRKRRIELEEEDERASKQWHREKINNEIKSKRMAAKNMIDTIRKKAFDPDDDCKTDMLTFFAKEAHFDSDNERNGMIAVIDTSFYYEDREGYQKSLLPSSEAYWPDKDQCIPTKKVKPAVLKKFFESIEKVGNMKCWWGSGYISHTSYNLRTTVNRQVVMHFELKG